MSCRRLKQAGDEGGLSLHVTPTDLPNLALSDHCHRLVARQRSPRRVEAAEAKAWPDQAFRTPMVLLDSPTANDKTGFCCKDREGL